MTLSRPVRGALAFLALLAGQMMPTSTADELRIANGDFGDLSGLTAGANGWYGGVPRGWESNSKGTTYTVKQQPVPDALVCSLSQLGFLLQEAGTLTKASDVELQFDVADTLFTSPEDVVNKLGSGFPENFRLRLDGKPAGLFITRWLRNSCCVNFLVNSAYSAITTKIRLEGKNGGKLWVYDPADGSIAPREASGSLTLEANTGLFLIEQP